MGTWLQQQTKVQTRGPQTTYRSTTCSATPLVLYIVNDITKPLTIELKDHTFLSFYVLRLADLQSRVVCEKQTVHETVNYLFFMELSVYGIICLWYYLFMVLSVYGIVCLWYYLFMELSVYGIWDCNL